LATLLKQKDEDRQVQPSIDEIEKVARIRLFRSNHVGSVTFYHLLKRYGSAVKALEVLPDLAKRGGLKSKIKIYDEALVEQEFQDHKKHKAQLCVIGDGIYPEALAQFQDLPPVISVAGNHKLLEKKMIAVVGARNCSITGKKMAAQLAQEIGEKGHIIISGLARGIDTQAHKASLESGTIGVIAGGINAVYPPENKDLFEEMREKGLLIAESPIGTEPQGILFPKRNRLIAALSQGVIIIEAATQSGSLITARFASEYSKDVFVVPGSPMDPRYQGSNQLIRGGATLVTSAQDVLDIVDRPYALNFHEANTLDEIDYSDIEETNITDTHRDDVLSKLSTTPVTLDELIRECELSASVLSSIVLDLELAGRAMRHPGNQISRIHN